MASCEDGAAASHCEDGAAGGRLFCICRELCATERLSAPRTERCLSAHAQSRAGAAERTGYRRCASRENSDCVCASKTFCPRVCLVFSNFFGGACTGLTCSSVHNRADATSAAPMAKVEVATSIQGPISCMSDRKHLNQLMWFMKPFGRKGGTDHPPPTSFSACEAVYTWADVNCKT